MAEHKTPDGTPEMFTMTYAGAFTACVLCGSLLPDGDGTKQHRRFHERVEPEAPKPPPADVDLVENAWSDARPCGHNVPTDYPEACGSCAARAVLSALAAAGRDHAAGVAEGRQQAAGAIRQVHDTWERLGKLPQSYLDGVADAAGIVERGTE